MTFLKNKKADIKVIVAIALAIFILLLLITITARGAGNWRTATENCPGQCKTNCETGEILFSNKCYENGEESPNNKCCISGEALANK